MIKCKLNEDIDVFDFTVYTYNLLKRNEVRTVADFIVVMNYPQKKFSRFCNKALIGKNSKKEMSEAYDKINIVLE